MLVLRRKAGESVLIGDGIEVEILSIEGGQVKLGIRAPKNVLILRKEVLWAGLVNRSSARQAMPARLESLVRLLRDGPPEGTL